MGWGDAAGLAARGVRRRFGRAVLTILAVTLAATLLVALLTVEGTARTRVLSQLAKGGPLAGIKVAAAAPDLSRLGQDNAPPGDPKPLDDAALARIRHLAQVKAAVPIYASPVIAYLDRPAAARTPKGSGAVPKDLARGEPEVFTDSLVSFDPRSVGDLPVTVLAGRLPVSGHSEVAITEGVLGRLHVADADAALLVGREITVGAPQSVSLGNDTRFRSRWRRLLIVGVLTQEAAPGQLVGDIPEVQADRAWTLAGGGSRRFQLPTSPYAGVFVVTRRIDSVGVVRQQITSIGYATQAPEDLIATVTRYLHVVEIVLGGIGVIALVIASLGIANALFAAVRERRREIGVLKAIGARDSDVLRIFLLEAGVLGLVGGIAGTLAGWGVASLVAAVVSGYLTDQGLAGVSASLPGLVVVGGIVGSTLLALAAGALPALRAARLPAREAVGS